MGHIGKRCFGVSFVLKPGDREEFSLNQLIQTRPENQIVRLVQALQPAQCQNTVSVPGEDAGIPPCLGEDALDLEDSICCVSFILQSCPPATAITSHFLRAASLNQLQGSRQRLNPSNTIPP